MKKLFAVLVLIAAIFALNGCSLELKSIETLMRPPLTATEQELEKSIDNFLGNNISLRSPASGSHHSAITLHDLDADKNEEAIIFYVNNNDTSAIRMCVLKKNSGGWQLVSDFAGNGSGIYSVDFYDLNNDGSDDMLVSWYLFEDRTNKTLTVYSSSRKGKEISFSACVTEPYNLICVEDVFSTGEKQIVLIYTDVAKTTDRTHIRLMKLNEDNRVVLLSETALDDRIISVSSIKADKRADSEAPRFFVDALLRDGKMITEILGWNMEHNSFAQLIPTTLQYDAGATVRSSNLYSYDIDADGVIEIPRREPLKENEHSDNSSGYLLVWYDYIREKFVKERSYAVNIQDNYRVFIPEELTGKLFVKNGKGSMWVFETASGEKLFSVSVYDIVEGNGNFSVSDMSETLLITADKAYVCEWTEQLFEYGIEPDELLKYFSLNS